MVGSAPQPPRCLKVTRACNKTAASCHRHVSRKGKVCMDHFVCKSGGLRTPPGPPHAGHKTGGIMSSPCFQWGKVVRIILFAMGGNCAPPQSPRCFQAAHVCNNKEVSCHHQACSKGKLCGLCGLFCSCLIFSEYILNLVLTHRTSMIW